MRLKKREIPTSRREMNVQEGDEVNKRPKGPHIVHLSTMCHLYEESAKMDIFVYLWARKTQTW